MKVTYSEWVAWPPKSLKALGKKGNNLRKLDDGTIRELNTQKKSRCVLYQNGGAGGGERAPQKGENAKKRRP